MLIQTLPPRLTWRVMATRADSIWRLVIQPGSIAWRPKSPKLTLVPPLDSPRMRPRCCLRCLTFFGLSIGGPLLRLMGLRGRSGCRSGSGCRVRSGCGCPCRVGSRCRAGFAPRRPALPAATATGATLATAPRGPCRAVGACRCRPLARRRRVLLRGTAPGACLPDGDDVALVDPDLDADAPEGGPRLGEAVVDVRPERVQRDLALVVALTAAHLGAAEAAGAGDLDALGPRLDRGVDRLAHRPAEGHPG